MNNSVFDLNQTFDFSILNLGNPTLANNNNYIIPNFTVVVMCYYNNLNCIIIFLHN